jgi:hypothetical protein
MEGFFIYKRFTTILRALLFVVKSNKMMYCIIVLIAERFIYLISGVSRFLPAFFINYYSGWEVIGINKDHP